MAPAAIQSELQRMWIPANLFKEGSTHPTANTVNNSPVYDFDPDAKQWLHGTIHVPLNWKANSDMFAYPVFCSDLNVLGNMRWGMEYVGLQRGISIAAAIVNIEKTIPCNGTATIIPTKPYWLTLERFRILAGGESLFQQDKFTSVVHIPIIVFRDGASVFDNHAGLGRFHGLAVVYEAFI